MRNILVFCFIFLGLANLYSQSQDDTDKVFTIVQQKPQFHGNVYKWLSDNISYPKQAVDSNIQGVVYVSFIIEKDGSVSSAKVYRGIKVLDSEAVRVINSMPRWTPGMQNGKPVRVEYMFPIRFELKDSILAYTNKSVDTGAVYKGEIQQKPQFSGNINEWLTKHMVYPPQAKNANIQGSVYVSFIVERDGSISTINILRGVDSYLNSEAIRVVSKMPKWTPGMQDGKPVRVQYMLPVHFILR